MFKEVNAFNDVTRRFERRLINPANVNAVDPVPVDLYRKDGHETVVKVWMNGYWFWLDANQAKDVQEPV